MTPYKAAAREIVMKFLMSPCRVLDEDGNECEWGFDPDDVWEISNIIERHMMPPPPENEELSPVDKGWISDDN